MILGSNVYRLINKLHFGGGGGGDGPGVGAPGFGDGNTPIGDSGLGNSPSTGNFGGSAGGTAGFDDFRAINSQIDNAQNAVNNGASSVSSGDPTSQGFGGTPIGIGNTIANGIANGTVSVGDLTSEQAMNVMLAMQDNHDLNQSNQALANQVFAQMSKEDRANFIDQQGQIPLSGKIALSAAGLPVTTAMAIGKALSVMTGTLIGDADPDANGPDITPEQYAQLSSEYGVSKDQIDQVYQTTQTTAAGAGMNSTLNDAINAILDVDTNIQYQHTLADLSGIAMDPTEKALLDQQKTIAMDRAIGEIEDTFAMEGDSMVAQQIYNLGTNALGGTIGQGFVKRWQEREAKAKTNATQDIEATYLAAERQAIDAQKNRQIQMWDQEFNADKTTAAFNLDKAKTTAGMIFDWENAEANRKTNTNIASLQRDLDLRMGNMSRDAWDSANQWNALGSLGGALISSWWK